MLDYDTPATVSQHFYNGIVIRAHVHSENGTIWLVGADVCKAFLRTSPQHLNFVIVPFSFLILIHQGCELMLLFAR